MNFFYVEVIKTHIFTMDKDLPVSYRIKLCIFIKSVSYFLKYV